MTTAFEIVRDQTHRNSEALAQLGGVMKREPTHFGMAAALADDHADRACFIPELNAWFLWDGKRWVEDPSGIMFQIIRSTIRLRRAGAEVQGDFATAKVMLQFEALPHVRGILALAATEPRFTRSVSEFDKNPWILNVQNGILDLRTKELSPHDPTANLSKIAGAGYIPGPCLTFERFILSVCNNRPELAFYLLARMGYQLTGDTSAQDFEIRYGTGANGKGVLERTQSTIMGDFHVSARKELFIEQGRFGSAGAGRPDLLRLRGARVVTVNETEDGDRLDIGFFKGVSGGDLISARPLFSNRVTEFAPSFKVILTTNHRPRLARVDYALRRRLKLIPFDWTVPEEKRDPAIEDQLAEEKDAILALLADGAKSFYERGRGQRGLPDCSIVDDASAKYADDEDVVGRFIREKCTVAPILRTQSSEIIKAFQDWSEGEGIHPMSGRSFSEALSEKGYQKKKSCGVMIFEGISTISGS